MTKPGHNRRSEARLRVVNEAGDLYAAESSDELWIKVGFSTRLTERLKVENMRAAVTAHRERFEALWAAEDRRMARIAARIAARQAANGVGA